MSEALETLRSIPRSAWIRVAVLVSILGAGIVVFRFTPLAELLTEERIVSLLEEIRETWWSPIVLLILYIVAAPLGLPMVPLLLGGAMFGVAPGSFYNTAGLLLGAVVSYLMARSLGRDFVVRITGERIRRAERIFDRHGFWPLVQTRFLPLPFPIVNFGAALAGVSPGTFVGSAVLGILPSTVIHTYFMARLIESRGGDRIPLGGAYLGAFVLFNLAIAGPWIRQQLKRRQRYREIRSLRAARHREINPDSRGP
jgi:uncharacterized membrane protein YdjX (TVP38/TMEM64 family)